MFQTEINHFFQSFESEWLTSFMRIITALGYAEFFLGFIIIMLFAIDFKKAFLLFIILMWTVAITYIFKDYFSLPRPFHVDNSLAFLDGQLPDEASFEFNRRGAVGFWQPLSEDVLNEIRKSDHIEYGFPSGHSSVAIAFWGAFALLYRKKWVVSVCIFLMVLIPISRIYLGVHFLADVIGGIVLGAILLGLFYNRVIIPEKLLKYINRYKYELWINFETAFLVVAPLTLLFFLPSKVHSLVAFLMGVGLGFIVQTQKGLPLNDGTILQRLFRTLLAVLVFLMSSFVIQFILESLNFLSSHYANFFEVGLGSFFMIWLTIEIAVKVGWYQRPEIPIISDKIT